MALNIWQMLRHIGETGGRTPFSNKMDFLYCDSWRKMRESASIRFSMPFWPLSPISTTDREASHKTGLLPPCSDVNPAAGAVTTDDSQSSYTAGWCLAGKAGHVIIPR